MGLFLYIALAIICLIWYMDELNQERVYFTPLEWLLMIVFGPFVISLFGLIDIYDDICYWYEECNE